MFANAGSSAFSNIVFQNFNIEAYSKDFNGHDNNIFCIYLTNEDDESIFLSGQNIQITLNTKKI